MAAAAPSPFADAAAYVPTPYGALAATNSKLHLEAQGSNWDSMPLSPPPPAYSVVEHERETERRKEKEARRYLHQQLMRSDSNASSVYGAQDEYGGQEDRMSILSFISYYEYFRPPEEKVPRDTYYA